MKNTIAVLFLSTVIATPAIANPTASVEWKFEDTVNAADNRTGVKATIADELAFGINGDTSVEWLRSLDSEETRVRYEVGATMPVFAGTFVRGGVGYKTYSAGEDFGYYVVEPGYSVLLLEDLSASVSYRWRAPFDTDINDATHSIKLGVKYNVMENVSVGTGYDYVRGDSDYNGYNVRLSVAF